jgi:hypothetical protein
MYELLKKINVEILKVVKLNSEKYKLTKADCACAGYEGYCSLLVVVPPHPILPPPRPAPFPL